MRPLSVLLAIALWLAADTVDANTLCAASGFPLAYEQLTPLPSPTGPTQWHLGPVANPSRWEANGTKLCRTGGHLTAQEVGFDVSYLHVAGKPGDVTLQLFLNGEPLAHALAVVSSGRRKATRNASATGRDQVGVLAPGDCVELRIKGPEGVWVHFTRATVWVRAAYTR